METLSDKLKSLGVQLGASNLPQKPVTNRIPIDQVVSGRSFSSPFGDAFVVEKDFDIGQTAGFPKVDNFTILSEWANTKDLSTFQNDEIIFLDTETSGLSGGTGTFAFMIGLGYFNDQHFHLVQLFMRDPSEEPALLAAMHHFLGHFKAVVTYNGKAFDIPLLNTRHIINGFTSPFTQGISHIDLLPLARRLWRNRLPSRTLKDLEVELLDVHRTQDEVPGWMVPELYYNYLRFGDAVPLAGVFYHNSLDVVSLAALFNFTATLLSHPLENKAVDSLDLIAIARLYDHQGHVDEAIRIYEKSLEQGLPQDFFRETILRFSQILKKRGNWASAIDLWKKGASQNSTQACIELAKYYEHHSRDYNQALYWCLAAMKQISEDMTESPFHNDTINRIKRIQQKIDRTKKKRPD